jgi:NADH-quinone oxidoreductase subunit M
MTLALLILVPLVAGLASWGLDRRSHRAARWAALIAVGLDLSLAITLWVQSRGVPPMRAGNWIAELNVPWIEPLGIRFHLGLDGLSLMLTLLTAVLAIVAVVASWTEIDRDIGLFHLMLLWVIAGITGVFLSLDLFLFYFFWELMLVPMYFLIGLWGHERRIYAAIKFFLFTQISGLLMLAAIVALAFMHHAATGITTFDYSDLIGTPLAPKTALWLLLGFAIAFAVKLPVVPFHTWLPDAHTEAPTAGSIVLAGLLLKTGAYGILRFAWPLFPQAASALTPVAMTLGVVGVLYGAVLAFGQTDVKRLVAYTSVSHMGFVVMGAFAGTALALQGAILQILCHGISTGALFALVGALQERTHTRDMDRLGGLWPAAPRLGAMTLFFALAAMGLPGLGNFLAEFFVLAGSYRAFPAATAIASIGFVISTVYALWLVQAVFYGRERDTRRIVDLKAREMVTMSGLVLLLVWLGLNPQPCMDAVRPVVTKLLQTPLYGGIRIDSVRGTR